MVSCLLLPLLLGHFASVCVCAPVWLKQFCCPYDTKPWPLAMKKHRQKSSSAAFKVRGSVQILADQHVARALEEEFVKDPSLRAKVLDGIRAGLFAEAATRNLPPEDFAIPTSCRRVKHLTGKMLARFLSSFEPGVFVTQAVRGTSFLDKQRLFLFATGTDLESNLPAGPHTVTSLGAIYKRSYEEAGRPLSSLTFDSNYQIDWNQQAWIACKRFMVFKSMTFTVAVKQAQAIAGGLQVGLFIWTGVFVVHRRTGTVLALPISASTRPGEWQIVRNWDIRTAALENASSGIQIDLAQALAASSQMSALPARDVPAEPLD